MGDRIAVMQKGGTLAQYAPPAELLMYPARRLRRGLRRRRPRAQAAGAPARARRRPLEGAARARRREPSTTVAREARRQPTFRIPLLVDEDGRPLGWLSERDLAGETRRRTICARARADRRARRRAARRALRPARSTAPSTARRRRARRASSACCRSTSSRASLARRHRARCRTAADARCASAASRSRSRRSRSASAAARAASQNNGFCPSWIVDNFDRYVDPLWQHVYLTLVSVAIGFVIAFGLALLAHRRRWLVGADHAAHRDPLHAAEPRGLLPAAADHRARQHDGDHRARRLHAADHLPQHHDRARQRARGDARTPGAGWG